MSGTQDEDKKPRRGGSLERDEPTSPSIETLERPCTACSHAGTKRRRGDVVFGPRGALQLGQWHVKAGRGNPLEG
jgi:hypothetical protein